MPGSGAVRSMPLHDQEIARSETSASTSVHVLPHARITTEGPIAPDRLRHELADSRRVSARAANRSAISRRAEPGVAGRHTRSGAAARKGPPYAPGLDVELL